MNLSDATIFYRVNESLASVVNADEACELHALFHAYMLLLGDLARDQIPDEDYRHKFVSAALQTFTQAAIGSRGEAVQ